MKINNTDHFSILREKLREYHAVEQAMIATNQKLCESDLENYQDSYKWLRLPIPGETPETISDMISSNLEDFPNTCLAGVLAAILKNGQQMGVPVQGLSIDRVDTQIRFCISGSISLEELRNLCEQYPSERDWLSSL